MTKSCKAKRRQVGIRLSYIEGVYVYMGIWIGYIKDIIGVYNGVCTGRLFECVCECLWHSQTHIYNPARP